MFQPADVLHSASAATRIKLRLAVLPNAKSGVGKIGKVPPIHKVLQRSQVRAAAVKLNHPAKLRRDLLTGGHGSAPGVNEERLGLGAGGGRRRCFNRSSELLRGYQGALR
jgi:hypothetical protein